MAAPASAHRPTDWTPLASADPVPGDPEAIRAEVRHMKDMATSLRAQAHDLRIIGHGEGLKGKYADKLRSGANDLEKHLRQTAERYEHVHGHLTHWAHELDEFQTESVHILHQARTTEANEKATAAKQHAAGHDPGPDSKPAADTSSADDPMRPHHQALARLTGHRDHRASHYAGKIKSACDDIIKDSTWERFEDTIGDILDNYWVKLFFEIASWLVTIVGLLALFFNPVGWLVGLCVVLTALITAKDVIGALTGNGSWADVAMDIVGYLGAFGAARALKALKGIRVATKGAAEAAAVEKASSQVIRDSQNVLDRSYAVTGRRAASRAAKAAAHRARNAVHAQADRAGESARLAERNRPMAQATKAQARIYGGDTEVTGEVNEIGHLRNAYPDSSAVQQASAHAGAFANLAKASWAIPALADANDKTLGNSEVIYPPKWSFASYGNLKNRFVLSPGSQW